MEMEAFTGKLHAYLRSVSTRVRLSLSLSLSLSLVRSLPPSLLQHFSAKGARAPRPTALPPKRRTGSERLPLPHPQIEELHTRVDKLDDRLTGDLKDQSGSFAAAVKGLDQRLSRGVQVRRCLRLTTTALGLGAAH